MTPANLHNFFTSILGASASFIGLLFVAISLNPQNSTDSKNSVIARRILAESSYAALINIFFVALVGLIPNANIGYAMIAMAVVGWLSIIASLKSGSKMIVFSIIAVGLSGIIYILEAIWGIYVIKHSKTFIDANLLMTLTIFLFAIALGRAWELTGLRSR